MRAYSLIGLRGIRTRACQTAQHHPAKPGLLGLSNVSCGEPGRITIQSADWQVGALLDSAGELPIVVLGTAYKPNTGLTTGSAAVLLCNLLSEREVSHIVIKDPSELARLDTGKPAAYFVGCPEREFLEMNLAAGSVVLDPWHVMPHRPGVETTYVGVPGKY
jgi:hypothetical protein